jgi:nicotinamidase-related amidase
MELQMNNTALIIIDVQNDYFKGGVLELSKPNETAANIKEVLEECRSKGVQAIHVQHENLNPNLPFMIPGTNGQKLHDSLLPNEGETLITKNYPNSFWKTDLEETLKAKGIEQLMITGMMTHMCVSSTARAAMERGFQVTIVEDACDTKSLEFMGEVIPAETVHKTALAEIATFTELTKTADVLQAL